VPRTYVRRGCPIGQPLLLPCVPPVCGPDEQDYFTSRGSQKRGSHGRDHEAGVVHMDEEWFTQLEAVPGVGYRSPLGVERQKLPRHNAKPTVRRFAVGGRTLTSVMWELADGGSTSQSPAGAWPGEKGPVGVGPDLLRRLHETLALPGKATDYHFAILGTCGTIWANRRDHPELIGDLERLCLLDIALVEAKPCSPPGCLGSSQNSAVALHR
jgi:hypothetical protein